MKKKLLIAILFIAFFTLITNFIISNSDFGLKNSKIIWGVNGHTLTSNDYKAISLDDQFAALKKEKFTYYRIDVLTDSDGKITSGAEIFDEFIKRCKANNVKVLPNVYLSSIDYNDTPELSYSKGLKLGTGFAKLYGKYFPVIEISNESELKVAVKDNEGNFVRINNKLQYDQKKLKVILQFLKGANDGVKKVSPKIKTLICISGNNTNFLEIVKNNVKFDIVGTNWYDVNLYAMSEYKSVLKQIKEKIRKPIWVTELNYREGSTNVSASVQKIWLNNMLDNLSKSKLVDAVFIYQLFDENSNLNKPGVPAFEANFGIYRVKNNKVEKKF
ncbi:MAG: hypothetical protein DI529_14880 [Chryseobacterium sp.]|nr:MAG: hypothetical protein DI529_14880 [Chryseobacterium sp.]